MTNVNHHETKTETPYTQNCPTCGQVLSDDASARIVASAKQRIEIDAEYFASLFHEREALLRKCAHLEAELVCRTIDHKQPKA